MDGGLQAHTKSFKFHVLTFVLPNPESDRLDPHLIPGVSDKSLRGYANATLGRSLCPLEYTARYDADREYFYL